MSTTSIAIGQFYPGTSWLHRLDPRSKLIFVFLYVIFIFFANNTLSLLWMGGLAIGALLLSRIPLSVVFRGMKAVFWLLLLLAMMHLLLTQEGAVVFQWGWFTVYEEGARQAGLVTVRLFFLILLSSLLTYTTRPMDLTFGLEKLLSPLKRLRVPVGELSLMMSIALRFIPTLLEETDKIKKAQMARGADFESRNLASRIRSLLPLLVPLFVSSFQRAEELALAMEARGYRGEEGRTRFRQLSMGTVDWLLLLAAVPFYVTLLFLRAW